MHRIHKSARWVSIIMATMSLCLGAVGGPVSREKPKLQRAPGYVLYVSKGCFECHGYNGQGSILTGPSLAPKTPDLAAMQAYVRSPTGQMPPYSATILSDSELAQIHTYLSSLPPSPRPESIKLLANVASPMMKNEKPGAGTQATTTAALFSANCAACHGGAGEGGAGPSLLEETSKRDLAQTIEKITAPRAPMPKLYPSVLSREQVEGLALYIRSFK